MNRAQLLWLQCWIALCGAVVWTVPPALPHGKYVLVLSGCWAAVSFTAIWLEGWEGWAHRFSAFFGFLLGTVEGLLGLFGLTERAGVLLVTGLLHACTFILSVMGRYLQRTRRRRGPSLDVLAGEAIREARESSDIT